MNFNEVSKRLETSCDLLTRLRTIVNKKWYDEQKEMTDIINDCYYHIATVQTSIKVERTKQEMIDKILKLCKVLNCCDECPAQRDDCPFRNLADNVYKTDFDKIGNIYDCFEKWIKGFLLDD